MFAVAAAVVGFGGCLRFLLFVVVVMFLVTFIAAIF
jgi:hypothetical protein